MLPHPQRKLLNIIIHIFHCTANISNIDMLIYLKVMRVDKMYNVLTLYSCHLYKTLTRKDLKTLLLGEGKDSANQLLSNILSFLKYFNLVRENLQMVPPVSIIGTFQYYFREDELSPTDTLHIKMELFFQCHNDNKKPVN